MDNLNMTIEQLSKEMTLFKEAPTIKNRTQLRKTLQHLKNQCHSLRKEVLGKTTEAVVVEEPVVAEEPVVVAETVEPEPVESHPIPDSQPEPVKVKREKKEKKERKRKKE